MPNETKAVAETGEIRYPSSVTIGSESVIVGRTTQNRKNGKAHKPETRCFKGHEFELRFTTDNKNKAKREAHKYHKRGLHTRVRESYPGVFSVYTRSKRA